MVDGWCEESVAVGRDGEEGGGERADATRGLVFVPVLSTEQAPKASTHSVRAQGKG